MINIKNLTKKYSADSIEAAFVLLFIKRMHIIVKKNVLIKSIIKKYDHVEGIIEEIARLYSEITIYDLINAFELLIPDDDRALNGAFFTPKNITQHIVKEAIKDGKGTVCDPSCGCGAFLIESAIYINKISKRKYVDIIENSLFGADIAEYSIRRAKILLTLLCLVNKEDHASISFNIFQADSLNFNWNKYLKDRNKGNRYDAIVGNPPYVKYQDLPDKLRKDLYNNWQTLKVGTYNLYFAFFELGIKLLEDNGILGYITPNNYFTSLSGINLRQFLSEFKYLYKILDFNHLKVFEAQTYTCITFLSKNDKRAFLYEKIEDLNALNHPENILYSKISFNELNNKKWRLLREKDKINIHTIENYPTKLKDIVDIKVGVATCKDVLFFIEGNNYSKGYYKKNYEDKEYLIEEACTKPIIRISDVNEDNDIATYNRRIIFPYKIDANNKADIISESEFSMKYPKCYEYLVAIKDELNKRDKGVQKYPAWYAYARSQGIALKGDKLITPTFSAKPRFIHDSNKERLFCNGYALYAKKGQGLFDTSKLNLTILSKILNSNIMNYYISNTSVAIEGGYPCYQKNFIEMLGIPYFTDKDISYLSNETDKNAIDNFLESKYNISIT